MTTTSKWDQWETEASEMSRGQLKATIDGLVAELPELDEQDREFDRDFGECLGGEVRDQLSVYRRVLATRQPVQVELGNVGSADRVRRIREICEQYHGYEVTSAAASAHNFPVWVKVDRDVDAIEAYKLVLSMIASEL